MKTILIVDSEPMNKEITKPLLGDRYHLIFSPNTKHVLTWAAKESAAMVLFEYLISNPKNTQFIANLKKIDPKIKIVLTSKQPDLLVPISSLGLDIDGYLEKPWNPVTFRPRIDRLLFCIHNDPLDQALACIQQHIQLPMFRVTDIADAISVSHQSIDSNFRLVMGCTPKEYIINLRINLAKYFLQTDCIPVKEIAFETGYQSYEVFAKQFHALVGKSPTEYRDSFLL